MYKASYLFSVFTTLSLAILTLFFVKPAYCQTFSGELSKTNTVDRHLINMPSNGTLNIQITTGPDLNLYGYVRLIDSDGQTVISSGSQGPGTTKIWSYSLLRAGTYYLELAKDLRSFYYGPYSGVTSVIEQPFANDSEPNNGFDQSNILYTDQYVSGHLGAAWQEQAQDMIDYWKITLPSDGELSLDVTTSEELNLYGGVAIYDADMETRLYWDKQSPDSNKIHSHSHLKAGTYYVAIEKDGRNFYWGSYRLKASHTPVPVENDNEINNDFAEASWLSPNISVTGHLGYIGQGYTDGRDWYRFTIDKPTKVNLEVSTSKNLNLYGKVAIFSDDGETSLYSSSQSPDTTVDHSKQLDAGKYFVLIEKDGRNFYWGWYTLKLTGVSDPGPDPDPDPTGQCSLIDPNLSLHIPCLNIDGDKYSCSFNYIINNDDPSGIYWELDLSSIAPANFTGKDINNECTVLNLNDLSIGVGDACLFDDTIKLGFMLYYYFLPETDDRLIWKLDMNSLYRRD